MISIAGLPALPHARLTVCAFAGALVSAALATTAARAQGVSGRVVVDATGRPLSGVHVRVFTDLPRDATGRSTARTRDTVPVAQDVTGEDGWFDIALPRPGAYRLQMAETLLAATLASGTADSTDAREYRVSATDLLPPGRPVPSDSALDALLRAGVPLTGRQVDRVAWFLSRPTRRAAASAATHEVPPTGSVAVVFVIDSMGRADPATFRIVAASAPAFADATRDMLSDATFRPAELRRRRVPLVVWEYFTFAREGEAAPPPPPAPPAVAALSRLSICR